MSNSQKKQQARAGIKTDKYGKPLNFGNYKNGRLVKPKGKGGAGGKGKGTGRNGNRGAPPPRSHQQQRPSAGRPNQPHSAPPKQSKQLKGEGKAPEKLASVGLSRAAHTVIQSALATNNNSGSNEDAEVNSAADCFCHICGVQYADAALYEEHLESRKHEANYRRKHRKSRNAVPDFHPPPRIEHKDPMGPMGDQRRGLPVYSFKESLLETIAKNRVTVVEGETGSGKTTQVPQFCLEDAAQKRVPCNIIIAQPRRISAMSVAERVAAERGEKVGGTVGYTIRLESKATANTRLLFCTTGILLKRLEEDATLQNVTHVFVDEVHERSIESDFLLMVLRDMLPKRPANAPLKVVLMSATLDASLFHDYFWDAPSVKFPGRTFPVTELYLEDAIEVTGHVVRGNEDWCKKGKPAGKVMGFNHPEPPVEEKDDMLLAGDELAVRYSKYSPNTQTALSKLDHDAIDYTLVIDTIQWLSNLRSPLDAAAHLNGSRPSAQKRDPNQDTTSSAILVFLPGIKEITTLQELLIKSPTFCTSPARDWVLPIHSTIPPEEQRLVFTRPPKGIRKVVLATNIAETAITIDDVAFVVDTGRMKENRYDPLKRMSSLEDCLVARSNARQRRGRAGRVREGVAVHLFTKHRHDKIAMVAPAPEVQRVPLEQLVLRIKALKYPGTAAEVCARLVEPPSAHAVQRAVEELVFLEAMTISGINNNSKDITHNKEELTALGVHLSTLPVDCRIGKLILLGAMFGVTDEALTIAATLSYRNPFQAPMMKREEADRAKMSFATAQSDHLTVLNAYKQVDEMGRARYDFCRENFLSIKTLQTIAGLKRQFLELLSAAGFVRPGLRSRGVEALGRRNGGTDGVALALEQGLGGTGSSGNDSMSGDWKCDNSKCEFNNFARNVICFKCKSPKPQADAPSAVPNTGLVREANESPASSDRKLVSAEDSEKTLPLLKALLVAALFPQMVIVEDKKLRAKTESGQKQEDMALHPSCITGKSINSGLSSKYLVYHERVKTTRVYIRDATPVSPYALILFGGGRVEVENGEIGSNQSVLRLDGWLGFKCPKRDHLLVLELREVLDRILREKVENPKKDFTEDASGIIEAVKAILEMDEDGKAMVPESHDKKVESAFDRLKKISNSSKGSGGKRPGKSGGRGRGGGRGGRGRGGRGGKR